MYQVSTVNLSADGTQARPSYGTVEIGDIDTAALTEWLEQLRRLDHVQNHEADPHLIIVCRAGKFHVRTGQGKLFLYNARASAEPYAELTADEIVAHLNGGEFAAAPFSSAPTDETGDDPRAKPTPSRGIAIGILFAGILLNIYTLYSVFYTETVHEKVSVVLLTDATERADRQRELVGIYATGDRGGDRMITVGADGQVRFSEIGLKQGVGENTTTYQIGKHGAKLCLLTADSGVVDVLNRETLSYYQDTYRRTR
jgi:hypothetical protein